MIVTLPNGLDLTRRESEVLELTLDGFSTAEIAARFEISQRTVEAHIARLLHTILDEDGERFTSRLQLVAFFLRREQRQRFAERTESNTKIEQLQQKLINTASKLAARTGAL